MTYKDDDLVGKLRALNTKNLREAFEKKAKNDDKSKDDKKSNSDDIEIDVKTKDGKVTKLHTKDGDGDGVANDGKKDEKKVSKPKKTDGDGDGEIGDDTKRPTKNDSAKKDEKPAFGKKKEDSEKSPMKDDSEEPADEKEAPFAKKDDESEEGEDEDESSKKSFGAGSKDGDPEEDDGEGDDEEAEVDGSSKSKVDTEPKLKDDPGHESQAPGAPVKESLSQKLIRGARERKLRVERDETLRVLCHELIMKLSESGEYVPGEFGYDEDGNVYALRIVEGGLERVVIDELKGKGSLEKFRAHHERGFHDTNTSSAEHNFHDKTLSRLARSFTLRDKKNLKPKDREKLRQQARNHRDDAKVDLHQVRFGEYKKNDTVDESSTNPEYKGKTRPNAAVTHWNLDPKTKEPATAGDHGIKAVTKALFKGRERFRGPHHTYDGGTRKRNAKGVAFYGDLRKEDVNEGLRLVKAGIHGHTAGDHARVYRDSENDEHVVKFYRAGVHQKNADYHTDDVEDAHTTAKAQLKKWMNESLNEDEFDDAKPTPEANRKYHEGERDKLKKLLDGTVANRTAVQGRYVYHKRRAEALKESAEDHAHLSKLAKRHKDLSDHHQAEMVAAHEKGDHRKSGDHDLAADLHDRASARYHNAAEEAKSGKDYEHTVTRAERAADHAEEHEAECKITPPKHWNKDL